MFYGLKSFGVGLNKNEESKIKNSPDSSYMQNIFNLAHCGALLVAFENINNIIPTSKAIAPIMAVAQSYGP